MRSAGRAVSRKGSARTTGISGSKYEDRRWLLNLNEGPTEQVKLAETRSGKLAELEARIEAHWADARDRLYPNLTEARSALTRRLSIGRVTRRNI
jgi:hypothetical protein